MPSQLPVSQYMPKAQPLYVFLNGVWRVVEATSIPNTISGHTERDAEQLLLVQPQADSRTTSSYSSQPWFHLITWNIDMKAPYGILRMRRALSHLHRDRLASLPPAEPVVIFFQEMTAGDIALICGTQWVRERFFVTDVDVRRWSGRSYGTVTLVDRRMAIFGGKEGNGGWGVFRVPFVSRCGRDGLFVDIALSPLSVQNPIAPPLSSPPSSPMSRQTFTKIFRLCNTHLESLSAKPPSPPAADGKRGQVPARLVAERLTASRRP